MSLKGTVDRPDVMTSLPHWNAFYAHDYGYTRMNVHNGTHITIEQVSVEKVIQNNRINRLDDNLIPIELIYF